MSSLSEEHGLASDGIQRSLLPGSYVAGSALPIAASEVPDQEGAFEALEFRSLADDDVETICGDGESSAFAAGGQAGGVSASAGREQLARDMGARDAAARDALDAARREGFQAGEQAGYRIAQEKLQAQMQARADRERERLLAVVQDFTAARQRYFGDVEQEVVKLALAIAARVLHRETQIDPLLLTAAVRVALEKMADRSGVVVRAPHAEVEAWERVFQSSEPSERPRVVSDALLGRGDCVLETKLGIVELGVRIQLEEIEKGFFDLLNHRPGR
jgi:flagellar assembly protein FliH